MTKNKVAIFVALLLVIDQIVKFIVKLSMTVNQSINVFGEWCQIRFIENPGAAYGMQLGGDYGKLILSIFRILLVVALIVYIFKLVKKKAPTGAIIGCSMVLAGALGNIIDGVFYGAIFSESTYNSVATLFPAGGGYSSLMHGNVVDMFYFPLIRGFFPDWFPFWGGEPFEFFRPIFNVADSYISVGIVYLIIFQRKIFE
ncbi:MAG: lipoprotein signal peptidase [Rikenellaceae bacterium]